MQHDPNADLVGFEYDIAGEGPTPQRWRITGTDRVLGANYVNSRRVLDDGTLSSGAAWFRVVNAGLARRRKQLDTEKAAA